MDLIVAQNPYSEAVFDDPVGACWTSQDNITVGEQMHRNMPDRDAIRNVDDVQFFSFVLHIAGL